MAEVKKGKKIVLLWRLLSQDKETDGKMMMFQEEHSVEKSRDADSTETKSGTIKDTKMLEEEVPFTSLLANDDPCFDVLNTAIDNAEKVELWEVDMNVKIENKENTYPAKYRQGYITELNVTANAEDNVEVEGTFATEMKAQTGEVELTAAQIEAAQYKFRNTDKVI